MKCSKCKKEIEKKEPLGTFYARASTGAQFSFILCPACFHTFSNLVIDFMKPEQ